ncbi:MAG: sensor domain-containing diguanylate cyclase [Candidatus Omnitrophica bacterium]|nr:sensor domain-containing diguanylate cyclase [Candidatus Omnitrophota bacterium]
MYELISKWQPVILAFLAPVFTVATFFKIKKSRRGYKETIADRCLSSEREYNGLVTEEGHIYDRQLKYEKRLSETSSLYEITKEMSASLHFDDIFKILAEYLQKSFLFKRVALILVGMDETSSGEVVYETLGIQDSASKAKGVFPKLEIAGRPLDENDKKIYELLKNDIRRIQITRTEWLKSPYAQYLPEDAHTFMAVPMLFEDRLIGILSIVDLSVSDLEKFSILAAQFSLEMRRIILYEKVEQMAITDGLTKAFAKRHIMERLGEEFERSIRHDFSLAFLMVDIDHFKNYNDTYGHLVGDAVLKDIVELLKNNTREVDLVGRFGGEEFCVILPETGKDEARLVAERIREMIENHSFKAYDESTNVQVSIGVAVYPEDAGDVNEIIENSDKALYAAKNGGRNKVCVCNG